MSTQGCAVLLAGYLVGKGISDDKRETECRANLKLTNDARTAKGQDAYPDMCGR